MFDKILIILALSITFLIVAIIFIINSWGHYGEEKEKYKSGNCDGGYTEHKTDFKNQDYKKYTAAPKRIIKNFYNRRK
ncbi:MAG: hypothetical protein HXM47_00065 [Pseudoleptotrichia goodfellowii]|nr:hypothetical protein [Pseudoleptotrichia goodfellowii]